MTHQAFLHAHAPVTDAARAYGLLDLASHDGIPDLLQMDGQLMQLIEVLQGRLTEARVAAMVGCRGLDVILPKINNDKNGNHRWVRNIRAAVLVG